MKFTNEEIFKNKIKQKKRKKAILTIILTIIVLVIIYNIMLILETNILPDIGLNIRIPRIIVIETEDMEPTLNVGDIIFIRHVEEEKIKENDIIAFKQEKQVILSRIIDILDTDNGKEYIIQKDNNEESSGFVKYNNIEGIYQEVKITKIGRLFLFMKNKITIIVVIILIVIMFIRVTNKKRKSKIRREKREKFDLK